MDIRELIDWHTAQLATAVGDSAAIHADAIATLAWCVELPAVSPDEHAKAYAQELLLQASAEQLALLSSDAPAGVPEFVVAYDGDDFAPLEGEELATERRFWRMLNANIAEQMG